MIRNTLIILVYVVIVGLMGHQDMLDEQAASSTASAR